MTLQFSVTICSSEEPVRGSCELTRAGWRSRMMVSVLSSSSGLESICLMRPCTTAYAGMSCHEYCAPPLP